MARSSSHRNLSPLDEESLRRLALRYVERYATSKAKFTFYLERKLYERGWQGENPPPVTDIADKFAELGYIDDQSFAETQARQLTRRGYGQRRVAQKLQALGIQENIRAPILEESGEQAKESALAFARRRRIGPYARDISHNPAQRQKEIASMMRAGHAYEIIKAVLALDEIPPEFETDFDS